MPKPPLTPSERSMRARLAAHKMHAAHNPVETTAAGRVKFNQRFEDEVDPDRVLPEPERLRRAESARKGYYAQLAFKSARARRERAS